ncbi:MAG: cytochrome P450 [Methylobacterium mesophilicum]|nr:cytochrome P450 [Methylobacterium mesophilicum]
MVFRHADLRAFGTAQQIGNVPIETLYAGHIGQGDLGGKQPGGKVAKVIASQVFTFNPPLHGPARHILTHWLGPRQISLVEGLARRIAQEIAETIEDGQEIDFVEAVSERLTVGFWARLLGLTAEETDAIGECARAMTRLFHLKRTAEDAAILDEAFADYAAVLDRAAERGLAVGDATLTDLEAKRRALDFADDPAEAGIPPKTLGAMLAGNLVDGFHTAVLASANTFFTLARHPGVLADARGAPALLARAIAEALRLEPPVLFLKRYVLRDFLHAGATIPAGSVVTMFWAAGNFDPAVFPEPERFNPLRLHAGLTTFGTGTHICPGRYAATMLIRVMIEAFEASAIGFEPAEEPAVWLPDHALGQLGRLPMRMRRAR